MLPRHDQPIVAVATAPGRGAVGIVRVSGRDLSRWIPALCGHALEPRQARYGPFLDADGQPIDRGIAIYFPAPHSYTGEDVVELQAHGGPVVLQLLVQRCLSAAAQPATDDRSGPPLLPGLRLAEPGEFSERAFLNGKLDLAQAEAVADLIDASTEAAARSASRSLSGAFSTEVTAMHEALVALRVLVEATLDFPEEEIDFLQRADAHGRLARIEAALSSVQSRARQGALLREGVRVVLAGQPNVGKSSLLNALAGAERAIVTPIAGTTRDSITELLQIDGVPLHVVDTAGLRDEAQAADEVERIGMQRSWSAIAQSDVVLFLHDATRLTQPDYALAEQALAARLPAGRPVIDVFNKADLAPADTVAGLAAPALVISARTGLGLSALRQQLLAHAGWQPGGEALFMARERHLKALRETQHHVQAAQALLAASDAALELLAEELRAAHESLGAITGRSTPDDLLGEIFSRFCIGK